MSVKPDLSRFPEITHVNAWFFCIDDDIVKAIEPLGHVLERAQNAVRFAWFSEGDAWLMRCLEPEEDRLRAGFFRAALAEFVSIEDILPLDLTARGITKQRLRLNETPNPHLHVFRELRNHEIHLRQSPFSREERDMWWGRIEHPEEATLRRISIWILDNITVESFSQLHNVKRNYNHEEVCKLIDWLNQSQAIWGIQQLFLIAVEDYCRELIRTFL
jgi:hypothetical protein